MFSKMRITDTVPVFLIFQHFASAYGNSPLFQTYLQRQLQEQSIQHLAQSLQQIDQSLRQPTLPYQQLGFPQQPLFSPYQQLPFSPFQPPYSPQQPLSPYQQPQPFLPLHGPNYISQLPFIPGSHQQLNLAQQQKYGQLQQPYPPLPGYHQQTLQQYQAPTCPQPAPICAGGRPAVCSWNAALGHPIYSCAVPVGIVGSPSGSGSITPSHFSVGPTSNESSDSLSKGSEVHAGGRSLLDMTSGPNEDAAPQPMRNPVSQVYPGANPSERHYPGNPGSVQYQNEQYNPANKLIYPVGTTGCLNCCFQLPFLFAALAGLQSSLLPISESLQSAGPLKFQCKTPLGYPCSPNIQPSSTLGTLPGQLAYPQPAVSPYYLTGLLQGSTGPSITGFNFPSSVDHGFRGIDYGSTNPWGFDSPIAFRNTAVVPGLQNHFFTEYRSPETQWRVMQPPTAGQIKSVQETWPAAGPHNLPRYIFPGISPGHQPPAYNPYYSQNQPILTETISPQNPPVPGGLYSVVHQPNYPGAIQTGSRPSKIPESKPRRQPRLQNFEPLRLQPRSPLGYPGFQPTFQNVPISQGSQFRGNPRGFGYQAQQPAAPLMPLVNGAEPQLQSANRPGFHRTEQLPSNYNQLVTHPKTYNPYHQTVPYFQNPVQEKRSYGRVERNPQNPVPYLTSGLSLLSDNDTEPPKGHRSPDSGDKRSVEPSKKTSRRPKKVGSFSI